MFGEEVLLYTKSIQPKARNITPTYQTRDERSNIVDIHECNQQSNLFSTLNCYAIIEAEPLLTGITQAMVNILHK